MLFKSPHLKLSIKMGEKEIKFNRGCYETKDEEEIKFLKEAGFHFVDETKGEVAVGLDVASIKLKAVDPGKKKFKCPHCDFSTDHETALKVHITKNHS